MNPLPPGDAVVLGVGVDVVSIAQVRATLERTGDAFLEHAFASEELLALSSGPLRAGQVATRFAVKEAVFKCLGTDWTPDASFADIVVGPCRDRGPEVSLHGDLAAAFAARGADRVLVSLSQAGDTAVAVAILV